MENIRGEIDMKKNKIAIIVFISVCILIFPFALEICIFRNNVYSVLSNGEWGSFLGSYIGGALGGIGTLLAVYITTKETRKIQQENLAQIESERKRNEKTERKKFADEIAKDIATYITDISKYFYACRFSKRLDDEERSLNDELKQISEKYHALDKSNIDNDTQEYIAVQNELEKLKQKELEVKYQIERKSKEIEQNRANRTIASERYFLLKIKLQNIESGADILKQLKRIHDNSGNVEETDLYFISTETDKLLNMTVQFVDRYVNQKLI